MQKWKALWTKNGDSRHIIQWLCLVHLHPEYKEEWISVSYGLKQVHAGASEITGCYTEHILVPCSVIHLEATLQFGLKHPTTWRLTCINPDPEHLCRALRRCSPGVCLAAKTHFSPQQLKRLHACRHLPKERSCCCWVCFLLPGFEKTFQCWCSFQGKVWGICSFCFPAESLMRRFISCQIFSIQYSRKLLVPDGL